MRFWLLNGMSEAPADFSLQQVESDHKKPPSAEPLGPAADRCGKALEQKEDGNQECPHLVHHPEHIAAFVVAYGLFAQVRHRHGILVILRAWRRDLVRCVCRCLWDPK